MSVKPFFRAHFKTFEDRKRFKELRHRFRASETAQPLIDYAARNDVDLVEDTDYLMEKRYGGAYIDVDRRVLYSRRKPALVILHEFRHAMQFDALRKNDPKIISDRFGGDLRRAFLTVVFLEGDACFHQDKVGHEMAGNYQTMHDPKVYFNYFSRQQSRIRNWFNDAVNSFSPSSRFGNDFDGDKKAEQGLWARLRYKFLFNRAMKDEIRKEKEGGVAPTREEMDYMRRLSSNICVDKNGHDYLLRGMTLQQQDAFLSLIWLKVFTPEIRAEISLHEHEREKNFHKPNNSGLGHGLFEKFSRVWPL